MLNFALSQVAAAPQNLRPLPGAPYAPSGGSAAAETPVKIKIKYRPKANYA